MRIIFGLLISFLIIAGCNYPEVNSNDNNESGQLSRGFRIDKTEAFTRLTVFNPWEKANNVSIEYYLVNRDRNVPEPLAGKRIIRTPVQRVICLSTTHLSFLDVLGEVHTVAGISGSQYISGEKIRERMEKGEVPDVGYGQNLNYELIVNQKPDVVLVYGIGSEVTSYTRKLEELGVPVVMVAEYLEETPLAKAEWIKFIAALFEKVDLAEQYFYETEEEYDRLKSLAAEKKNKPKVLVGSPYRDTWWVPGGKSYMANLIADAGGDYLGSRNSSHESYVISFENALAWSSMADVWINMGNLSSKREITGSDQRFENFKVLKEGKLYNNIRRLSSHGGNDFWESGTVNPHLILRDLMAIFHPDLVEEEMIYYTEIE
jgi:iron complex transport system substrate-binding protein